MEKVFFTIAILLYKVFLIALACYMVVNHGWYWIFLFLLGDLDITIKGDDTDDER